MAKLRQRVAGAHDAHPIAAGLVVIATATLALAEVLVRSSDMVFNVNFVSVRQALTPDRLQGRVGATIRALTYGVVPLGALVGGQLGGAIGLRGTVLVGAAGVLLAFLWVALSPVRALDTFPMVPESPVPDEPYVGANRVLLTSRYGFSGTFAVGCWAVG